MAPPVVGSDIISMRFLRERAIMVAALGKFKLFGRGFVTQ
jgi:hypothetical protein